MEQKAGIEEHLENEEKHSVFALESSNLLLDSF